jgi:hypothetical protein
MTTLSVRPRPAEGKGLVARPFSAVPHDLVRDRRLIATDVVVVAALLFYARASATCWPSVGTLMNDAGRGRRAVQMSLRRLKDAGWVGERAADNPTGRVLVLTWRDGAQRDARGGRNEASRGGAQASAPESKNQKEERVASPPGGERGKPEPRETMTPDEVRTYFTECGWLAYPEGHDLRRRAERWIDAALRRPRPVAAAGSRRRSGPRPLFV